jgi:hypothetical protein
MGRVFPRRLEPSHQAATKLPSILYPDRELPVGGGRRGKLGIKHCDRALGDEREPIVALARGQMHDGLLTLAKLNNIDGQVEVGLRALEGDAVDLHDLSFDSGAQQQENHE